MRFNHAIAIGAITALAAACAGEGTSTEDVREAALERARQHLSLSADVPLEASVWAGGEYEGEVTACGTISSQGDGGIAPLRFAATTSPLRWLIFEEAHNPVVDIEPDMFADWTDLCGVDAPA